LKNTLLNKLIFILLCGFTLIDAAKGPQYNSIRVRGMGGAFVAVADDRNALYYNPAGLNLINRFGNFEKNPDMGYLPRQRFELKLLGASVLLPSSEITYVQNVCGTSRKITLGSAIKSTLLFDFGYFDFGDIEFCPVIMDILGKVGDISDSLNAHPELADSLAKLDRRPIEIGVQVSVLEFAMHNFGLSVWMNTRVASWIESGVYMPYFGYEPVQIDAVAQTAMAFSPVDDWSVGVGLKTVRRSRELGYEFKPLIYGESIDTLRNRWESYIDNEIAKFDDINFALDFGALYQLTREVRLGTSLRNVFFSDLAGESITPNLSIGAAYSPILLQSNDWWGRKVNFAMDYDDILDGTVGSMFLSHLNFGAEIDQVILPSPTKNMPLLWRAMFGALGGVVGGTVGYLVGGSIGPSFAGSIIGVGIGSLSGIDFGSGGDLLRGSLGAGVEGGYWAATGALKLALIEARFSSYAEERGLRTGQKEQRFWAFEINAGF
jgi:hypothetical protein